MESHEKVDSGSIHDGTPNDLELNDHHQSKPEKSTIKDFDDLLPYLGEFGWYQRILFLLMIPFSFFFAFVYFSQIFMTVVPENHWCRVEELQHLSVEMRKQLSIPRNEDSFHKCLQFDVNWTQVLQDGVLKANPDWSTKKCENWEFEFTDVPYETIASQLGWVCEKDGYPATAQAIFFCGAIFGGLIFGRVADKYGRIPALMGTNLCAFLAGVGTAFTNSFWSFCLCRFLVGLAYDNCFMVMYILVIEFVGPKWRTFVANMSIAVFFTFAACLLPWIALGVDDWRVYTLVTSMPLALAVFTPWVVPESVRKQLSIPRNEDSFHKCLQFDVNWTQVLQDGVLKANPDWSTKKCENWEFEFTDVPYETIASQLGWVCEKDGYPATAQAIFFCGAIFGGLIFGRVADKYGRIPALMGTNLCAFLAGVGTAFTNSFWSFCLCRFLVGLAYDNCFMVMYILVIEFVGPKWRTFVANMSIAVFFTFAACLLPWIALGVDDWRVYTLVTSMPLALAVFTPWVVPESVRWLISQGRIEESIVILKKIEKINRKKIPDEVLEEFKITATHIAKTNAELSYTTLDLFKTPRLRRHSILLFIIWMSIAMVFDGHVRNVGSLGLDMFLTFTVATATELPADILLTLILDHVGRRWLAFGSMAMSGIFSLLATTVPIGVPTASLALIGRFAVNISYNIGMQYAAELLPTVLRGQGLAAIHIMGYFATILVPYIVYLATISAAIPLIILGALGIFGGSMCLLLPESTGQVMPETIQDGEEYGRGQGFWDMPVLLRKKKSAAGWQGTN